MQALFSLLCSVQSSLNCRARKWNNVWRYFTAVHKNTANSDACWKEILYCGNTTLYKDMKDDQKKKALSKNKQQNKRMQKEIPQTDTEPTVTVLSERQRITRELREW